MDDREAIRGLKRGDISGLEVLVRQYQVQALRAAQLITRDRGLAEDIVQGAFLRAYERIDQFDLDRPFRPWFLRTVVNAAVKTMARAERHVSLDGELEGNPTGLLELLQDTAAGPETLFDQAETRQAVRQALARLSPAQRAAVVLRYFLGLTEGEIADQLGSPRGTVKRRLYQARERLKTLLAGFARAASRPSGTE